MGETRVGARFIAPFFLYRAFMSSPYSSGSLSLLKERAGGRFFASRKIGKQWRIILRCLYLGLRKMREISFTITFRHWGEGVRIGWLHLRPLSRGRWLCIPLLMTAGFVLIMLGKGYPASWPPAHLPPRSVALSMGLFLSIVFVPVTSAIVIIGGLTRAQRVEISPNALTFRYKYWSTPLFWKNVVAIEETEECYCFCQETWAAFVVPRSAFPNQEQADTFMEQAMHYWRRETGYSEPQPSETSGVWPPAPQTTGFQEPDSTGKH